MEIITSPNYNNSYATHNNQVDLAKMPIANAFQIRRYSEHREFCLLEIHYPHYQSYNGMVYLIVKASIEQIKNNLYLDTHFLENQNRDPNDIEVIVRLKPSSNAWEIGMKFLRQLEITPNINF